MPDQDFKINVITTYDGGGLRKLSDDIDSVEARTRKISPANLAFVQAGGGVPIPPELLTEPGLPFEKTAEETEKAAEGAAHFGQNLTRARQEAIILARELATGVPTTRTLSSLMGALGYQIAGVSLIAGALYKGAALYVEYQQRINSELDQQLTKLTANAEKWRDIARATLKPEDVAKVAAAALPELEAAQAKMNQIQNQGITGFKAVIDSMVSGATFGGTIFAHLADLQASRDAEQVERLRQLTLGNIKLGEETEKSFAAKKLEPTSKAIDEIVSKINKLKLAQEGAFKLGDIVNFVDIGKQIANQEAQLKGIIDLEKERVDILSKDSDIYDTLSDKINRLQSDLKGLGVSAKSPGEAFEAALRIGGAVGDQVANIARQWATLRAEQSKALQADLFKGPVTAQLESINRQKEFLAHVAAQRELAAEGIGKEVSQGDIKKEGLNEELQLLQRQQALQRQLIPEGEQPSAKFLGTEGLREFEARAERIRSILTELSGKPERPVTPAAQVKPETGPSLTGQEAVAARLDQIHATLVNSEQARLERETQIQQTLANGEAARKERDERVLTELRILNGQFR